MDLFQLFKSLVISVAIAFLIPVTVFYGAALLSPMPLYSTYAQDKKGAELETAQKEYNDAVNQYHFNYFIINIVIGALLILLGYTIRIGFLGAGFILGGIFCLVIGSFFYWHQFSIIIKFVALLSVIFLLIIIAYLIGKLVKQ